MRVGDPPVLEWGLATRTLPGQAESGDTALVQSFEGGVLAAVVDGLGHGPEAARAAQAATRILGENAGQPIVRLLQRSHERLARTRGVVMSVACFDATDGTMTWLGVGNVEGRLLRRSDEGSSWKSLLLLPGIVGYRLPPLKPVMLSVGPGDILIVATDGIRSDFAEPGDPSASSEEIARRILTEKSKDTDDALVLVVRYLGGTT